MTTLPPTGYEFRLTCPDDGGPMHLGGTTHHEEDHVAALATCKACGTEWDIDVRALRRPKVRSRIARITDRVDAGASAAVLPGSAL